MTAMTVQRFEEIYFDGVADMVAHARSSLRRTSARAAFQEAIAGTGVIIDIRSERQRAAQGAVPPLLGAVVVERNELEPRLDPRSATRLPFADHAARVIVLCSDGEASSLAAASLRQLGVAQATDVIGGFAAWCEAGMPVG
ncbi:rhodanese-like domain-containing protein [Nocardioides sp. AE5]|uniref:rhodanese-like domain-containing protein n=1 Tax=Nocardioides sp. AE5 TaxID=2962573 RepID=UPI0028824E8F|nr:rhodanese-like domain-containing protein [Nocardioides sp. AE5]MDT0202315.1 rhodanese-like domain-containing protein [Nocardioides sp. AE5]